MNHFFKNLHAASSKKKSFRFFLILNIALMSTCSFSQNEYTLPDSPRSSVKIVKDNLEVLEEVQSAFSDVVKNVSSSVVYITISKTVETPDLPFFDQFFGPQERRRGRPEFEQRGAASGFIIDKKKGYILTNYHVVGNADTITVITRTKREYKAKVIGSDPATDVAVIQVNNLPENLGELILTDSDKIDVGDLAFAVGAPLQLPQTVTQGIISAKGRGGFAGISDFGDFIQTDAAINVGNSGGPLININGEVMGMNTFIISPTGGSSGLGFAIPSNILREVSEKIINYGEVKRAYLGVYVQDLTPQLADQFDVEKVSGALVSKVEKNSPAAKAGIKSGDIITEVNGEDIRNAYKLIQKIGLSEAGEKADITFIRDGKTKSIAVTLKSRKETSELSTNKDQKKQDEKDNIFSHWDMKIRSYSNPGADEPAGVQVIEVTPGSIASMAGIQSGDIIVEVNKKRVKNYKEFAKADDKENKILLRVFRGGFYQYVSLER